MSCVPLTDRQSRLLAALSDGPRPAQQLDPVEVDVMCGWGWLFGQGVGGADGAAHYLTVTVARSRLD